MAADQGHTAAVEALLRLGADPNATASSPHHTALMQAAGMGHKGVVAMLLKAGADPAVRSTAQFREHPAGSTAREIAERKGVKRGRVVNRVRGEENEKLESWRKARLLEYSKELGLLERYHAEMRMLHKGADERLKPKSECVMKPSELKWSRISHLTPDGSAQIAPTDCSC